MTAAVPEREPLGASTVNRKWYLDVATGEDPTTQEPIWAGVFGIVEYKPVQSPTLQDDSDYDSEGWKSQTVTAQEWGAELKVSRKVTQADGTAYDPGQEFLRLAANELGTANSVTIRYYEMTPDGPRVEAYEGNVAVTWEPDGGAMDALDTVSVKLTGQGRRNVIAHPSPTV